VSAWPVARVAAGDRSRLFVTALLVYAACLNPAMFNPMLRVFLQNCRYAR